MAVGEIRAVAVERRRRAEHVLRIDGRKGNRPPAGRRAARRAGLAVDPPARGATLALPALPSRAHALAQAPHGLDPGVVRAAGERAAGLPVALELERAALGE